MTLDILMSLLAGAVAGVLVLLITACLGAYRDHRKKDPIDVSLEEFFSSLRDKDEDHPSQ